MDVSELNHAQCWSLSLGRGNFLIQKVLVVIVCEILGLAEEYSVSILLWLKECVVTTIAKRHFDLTGILRAYQKIC